MRVRADRGLDGARAVVLLGSEPGLLVQRVGRAVERRGDRIEHALGRLAQPALDLRQVRIRDPGEVRELAHAQLAQLPLAANDLAELGRTRLSGHLTLHDIPERG